MKICSTLANNISQSRSRKSDADLKFFGFSKSSNGRAEPFEFAARLMWGGSIVKDTMHSVKQMFWYKDSLRW